MRRLLVLALVATLFVLVPSGPPALADGNEAPGAPEAFRSITAGAGHTCAVRTDGAVRCWGDGRYGALGLGSNEGQGDSVGDMAALPTVDLGTGRTATALTAGYLHTCALLEGGDVKCWGDNSVGQLGLGDTTDRGKNPGEMGDALPAVDLGTGRTATAITTGVDNVCALLDTGQIKCWGENDAGQLGLGDTEDRSDEPGEMGDALLAVDLGAGRTATAITAGQRHACALLDNGQVKCWGRNVEGELGLGTTAPHGVAPGQMGDALPVVALGSNRTAVAVAATGSSTCALLDDDSVKCWGSNSSGALGLGDTADRGDGLGEMGDALPAVDLGAGRTATAITAGSSHTCALLDTSQVRCWGANVFGSLGLGDGDARGNGPGEMGDALPTIELGTDRTVTALTSGSWHNCALLDNDQLKCWGDNNWGKLGLGDTAARGDEPGEMGDALAAVDLNPPNDDFVDAQVLTGPTGTVRGSNANAFYEGPEPLHAGIQNSDTTVWYRWTAPAAGTVRFDTAGSNFDTILAVYTGNALTALSEVAANDDTNTSIQSQVDFTATAGTTYQVVVSGFGATGSGRIQLNWAQPPANDAFAAAAELTGVSGTRAGTTLGAGLEAAEPDHNPNPDYTADHSIWYRWTPTTGGRTTIDTVGSAIDTTLAVYTGTALDALTVVAANDDIGGLDLQSRVVFTATAGTTYRIAVARFENGPPGATTLNWRQSALCDGRAVTRDLTMGDPATGTPAADVIRGTGGNDTINGGAGADRICGGNGTDTLTGGTGAAIDRLFGENGTDTLRGGAGNDALFGGAQNDSLFGEAGADTLNGGGQRDTCNGGPQRDTATTCEVRTAIP